MPHLDTLCRVVAAVLRSPAVRSVDPQPLEAELNHDALRSSLTRAVPTSKRTAKCLIVEFSEQAARMPHLDTLCWHLAETVERLPDKSEFEIVIIVHNLADLTSSYVL